MPDRTEYHRQYSEKNKERISERQKEYYLDNRKEIIHRCRAYYYKNKDKVLKRQAEYYAANKDVKDAKRLESKPLPMPKPPKTVGIIRTETNIVIRFD